MVRADSYGLFKVTEVWRPVPRCDGLLASSLGRLMVAPYSAPMPRGGVRTYGGEASFGVWDGKRYVYRFAGKTYKAHRLVCSAFHGESSLYCLHIDENARNNRADNLKWGTQKENLNAPGYIEYCKGRTGANNPYIKGRNREATL